jgi:hypothetical protein
MWFFSKNFAAHRGLKCRVARFGGQKKRAITLVLIFFVLVAWNNRESIGCRSLSCITHPFSKPTDAVCPVDRAVVVRGVRSGSNGLGNTLFQIATAVYYAKTFGFDVFLDSSSPTILWGTSAFTNRDQIRKGREGAPLSYLQTIFSSTKLRVAPLDRCNEYVYGKTARTIEDGNNRELREPGNPAAAEGRRRDDVDGSALLSANLDARVVVHNDYTGKFYIPQSSSSRGPGKADKKRTHFLPYRRVAELAMPSTLILEISGYCQNISLFLPVLDVIPDYLTLRDPYAENKLRQMYGIKTKWKTESPKEINSRLLQKKKILHENGMREQGVVEASKSHASTDERNLNTNILVGVRWGSDFSHMKKVTMVSYERALNHLIRNAPRDIGKLAEWKLVVLADVSASQLSGFQDLARSLSQRHATRVEVVIVEEDDITQLQAGLACDRFVLSESTFHLWIALLRTGLGKGSKPRMSAVTPSNVVVFEDTDVTNRGLVLEGWTKLPY